MLFSGLKIWTRGKSGKELAMGVAVGLNALLKLQAVKSGSKANQRTGSRCGRRHCQRPSR